AAPRVRSGRSPGRPARRCAGARPGCRSRRRRSARGRAAAPGWGRRGRPWTPAGAPTDARRAPRSGQGIVGSRVVVIEVGVAERPLAAGEQDPDRADGEVEGGGDLRGGGGGGGGE